MKLTTAILTALLLFLFHSASSQHITYSGKKATLKTIIGEIEKQTGFIVSYTDQLLNGTKPVSIEAKKMPLKQFLEKVLADQLLQFMIDSKTIFLSAKSNMDNPGKIDKEGDEKINPSGKLSGKVLGLNDQPLIGATIYIRGKNGFGSSNHYGIFELDAELGDIIVVSYVGYKTKEMKVVDGSPLTIYLIQNINSLDTTVVVNTGYQKQKMNEVTGSVTHISNELFNRRVGATVLERINDLVPGLLIRGEGGSPLNSYSIRGVTTIEAGKAPILVVDNFIYEGDPNSLNPNDVESVTILKDAAAASIWGVRAGNGVIVVTTKQAKYNQRPTVSINSNITIEQKPDFYSMPLLSSKDVIGFERNRFEAGYYDGALNYPMYPFSPVVQILAKQKSGDLPAEKAEAMIKSYEQHDIRDDVNKYLIQLPIKQQYYLNLSGGGSKYRYTSSIGFDKSKDLNVNMSQQRTTIRFSNTWLPVKNLELSAELNWGQTIDRSRNELGSGFSTVLTNPYLKLADENGSPLPIPYKYNPNYIDTVQGPGMLDWHFSPIDETRVGNLKFTSEYTRIGLNLAYSLLPELKIAGSYQWQKSVGLFRDIKERNSFFSRDMINQFVTVDPVTGMIVYPYPSGATFFESNSNQVDWNFRSGLDYRKVFGQHTLTAMMGIEFRETGSETIGMRQVGYNAETGTFGTILYGNWTVRPDSSVQSLIPPGAEYLGKLNRYGSYYMNAGYHFAYKYFVSGSARLDQCNFFGVKTNDRTKPLWSAGLAWDLSKEKFFSIPWLEYMKVKVSYGYSGNVNAGNSPLATIQYMGPGMPTLLPYAKLKTSPNPRLKWETVRTLNLGWELSSNNQRLSASIEYYWKRGLDLISSIPVDPTSGFREYIGNQASIKNSGLDLQVTHKNLVKNFQWTTTFNFAYNAEKVTAYAVEPPQTSFAGGSPVMIGKPLQALYSYRWAGLDPQTGDALFYSGGKIVGSVENYNATAADMVYGGRYFPTAFGSVMNYFHWRNLSISLNMNYQFGGHFRRISFSGNFSSEWQHQDFLQAWKAPGDELKTNVPAYLEAYPDARYDVYAASDMMVEKSDQIRLQDIRINYEFPRQLISKLKCRNVSVYAYLNNLGTLWKASRFDLETQNGLAPKKSWAISFGINVGF